MHEIKKRAFHAVLVQYGHDPTSHERLNIGVILVCPKLGFYDARFTRKLKRVSQAFPVADITVLKEFTRYVEASARKLASHNQLELLPGLETSDAFYYSAFPKIDSAIALSQPICGVTSAPEETLRLLFDQYVNRFIESGARGRDEADIWRQLAEQLKERRVPLDNLMEKSVTGRHYEYTFQHAWKNGRWNAVQPLSFDLAQPGNIGEKATKWLGKMRALHLNEKDIDVVLLVGPPSSKKKEFRKAMRDGYALLEEELKGHAKLVMEPDAGSLVEKIARDLTPH